MGEGESGMIWENGVETCILSCKKQIASLGSIQDTGCLGLVHWDEPEEWYREGGGGFRMGNMCTPVADSCQCMAKPIQCCKEISLQKKLKKNKTYITICKIDGSGNSNRGSGST